MDQRDRNVWVRRVSNAAASNAESISPRNECFWSQLHRYKPTAGCGPAQNGKPGNDSRNRKEMGAAEEDKVEDKGATIAGHRQVALYITTAASVAEEESEFLRAAEMLALRSEKLWTETETWSLRHLAVWASFSVPILEIFCQQKREGGVEAKEIPVTQSLQSLMSFERDSSGITNKPMKMKWLLSVSLLCLGSRISRQRRTVGWMGTTSSAAKGLLVLLVKESCRPCSPCPGARAPWLCPREAHLVGDQAFPGGVEENCAWASRRWQCRGKREQQALAQRSVDLAMTLFQPFNASVLWLSLLMVISSVNRDKPEEKMYSCPVIQCSAPAVNGLPGRDGRDGPKGEGLRSLQGFPREVGPPEIKGDLGPQREKGQKGECGIVVTDDLQRQVTALETKVRVLEDGLNRYKKDSLHANPANLLKAISFDFKKIKSIGKKIFVSTGKEDTFDNGKSLCAKAGSAFASPRNEAENTVLKDLRPSKQAYMGICDEQTEGMFMYLNGGAVTYRNWNAGEPNNLKNEDCAVIQDSGKWNDVNCSNSHALTIRYMGAAKKQLLKLVKGMNFLEYDLSADLHHVLLVITGNMSLQLSGIFREYFYAEASAITAPYTVSRQLRDQ
ncbi:hypothetical protein QYF61_013510 [Mycteria americana]|uniref:C-type lectin domain-containing protein n=1 Tax=Mycteria americana TaxID=33587 RepID=A0AAN7NAN4_MYCAM|nr:hypothetical protein QYF61_013510 [Mycteria americana]